MKYLANAFFPSMVELPAFVEFKETTLEEFCQAVTVAQNAIGHKGTTDIINQLCGTSINTNRIQIRAKAGDELYIFTIGVRLEEGRVLSKEELEQLLKEGKIKFVRAKVIYYKIIFHNIKRGVMMEKRNQIEIVTDILGAIEKGISSKSGIMKNANVSIATLNKYIKILTDKGLVMNGKDGRFIITEKGVTALKLLKRLRELEVEVAEIHLLLSEIL